MPNYEDEWIFCSNNWVFKYFVILNFLWAVFLCIFLVNSGHLQIISIFVQGICSILIQTIWIFTIFTYAFLSLHINKIKCFPKWNSPFLELTLRTNLYVKSEAPSCHHVTQMKWRDCDSCLFVRKDAGSGL